MAMHGNERLLRDLYGALSAHDVRAVQACYAPDAEFHDPIFPTIVGAPAIGAMWQLACTRAADLSIVCCDVVADDEAGCVVHEARYTFPATGRRVVDRVRAHFAFADGKIIAQQDDFSLWRWSRQALGAVGWVFGWAPMLRSRIRRHALMNLRRTPPT
jgi:ketosteroid isomerase-like protein